jgi:hypothetical protein
MSVVFGGTAYTGDTRSGRISRGRDIAWQKAPAGPEQPVKPGRLGLCQLCRVVQNKQASQRMLESMLSIAYILWCLLRGKSCLQRRMLLAMIPASALRVHRHRDRACSAEGEMSQNQLFEDEQREKAAK